ncbi:hypothetical protein SAMN04487995_6011 [Dyadobacter koreensis]|uniref:Uncharacterized protein n=1 Tax=Dyadobacter koreensis TaxID=408657 RepID=A0A1H7B8T9_9BACT|nr:hypothetical protein SAMN04487995_6011 [Dyadobacter koreensis]
MGTFFCILIAGICYQKALFFLVRIFKSNLSSEGIDKLDSVFSRLLLGNRALELNNNIVNAFGWMIVGSLFILILFFKKHKML